MPGTKWIDEATKNPAEKKRREEFDFLTRTNQAGLFAAFLLAARLHQEVRVANRPLDSCKAR